jgi:hypothetical protein
MAAACEDIANLTPSPGESDESGDDICESVVAVSVEAAVRPPVPKKTKPAVKKRKDGKQMLINITNTRYPVGMSTNGGIFLQSTQSHVVCQVREVGEACGMAVGTDADHDGTFLFWHDLAPPLEFFTRLKDFQRLNHFPSTEQITRKDGLARNLNRIAKHFPAEYNFFPRSWILPAQVSNAASFLQSA